MNDDGKVVLDGDDMRRTLVRIAHEIVEQQRGSRGPRDRRHPPPRRGPRRAACTRSSASCSTPTCRSALVDITFYRDDLADAQPTRRSSTRPQLDFPVEGAHRRPRRRRPLHRAHGPRRDRGALRLRPPGDASSSPSSPTAATASCRSAPTTSARTCRPRARSGSTCASPRSTASTRSTISDAARRSRRMRHLLSIEDLDRADDRARSATAPQSFAEVGRPRHQEGPDAARPHRRQPLLRGEHAHALARSSSPPSGSRADVVNFVAVRLLGRQGRVAEGHGR